MDVGADGTIAVTYYDFRANTPDPPLLTDYFVVHCHPVSPTACLDPANWVDERRLTNVSFDMRQAPFAGGFFTGDYAAWRTPAPCSRRSSRSRTQAIRRACSSDAPAELDADRAGPPAAPARRAAGS